MLCSKSALGVKVTSLHVCAPDPLAGFTALSVGALMCRSRIRSILLLFALLLSIRLPGLCDARQVSGTVLGENDKPVTNTDIWIEGVAGSHLTSDRGMFDFPMEPPLRVGFAATFHVKNWVVTDPFV